MSNLLEQAIIDAAALRETALNSAKEALIDKYKDEFQKSVEKLFEQDEPGVSPPPEAGAEGADLGLDPSVAGMDSTAGVSGQEAGGEALKDVPSSFLDGDDDEIITIDFDQIEKQISDALSSPMLATPEDMEQPAEEMPETSPEEIASAGEQPELQQLEEELEITEEKEEESEEDEEDDELEVKDINKNGKKDGWEVARAKAIAKSKEKVDEELELDLEEAYDQHNSEGLNIDALTEIDATQQNANRQTIQKLEDAVKALQVRIKELEAADKAMSGAPPASPTSTARVSEDFEITEEEIQELAEELKVDIDVEGLLDGHMGTHETEKREVRDMELAAARDECEEDDRKEEEEKLGDLKKELEESLSQNKKYLNLIEELKDNLIVLKEQTEKLSVSNAKLLYINKVFGNSSLNERQKETVVESISRASTVLEAKTIFQTLQSTVDGVSNKKSKESLSEALNRNNRVFSVRPKVNEEEYTYSDRFKILAGIKDN